jgi:uncharacterized membrane protein (UPF0127 family)
MNLPRIVLTIEGHRIDARVARTEEDRATGLMFREELAPDEGMLFVHDAPIDANFWMKDTPLDLSIAFVDDEGRIVNVAEMDAHDLEGASSLRPVRFVLEMSTGWFTERGIGPGAVLDGLPLPTNPSAG